MYSKIKIAGHPVHPMLVAFPVDCLRTLAGLPPDACHRATALAEAGPRALARHLDSHAAAWRNSLRVTPQPESQALGMTQRAGNAPAMLALTERADGKGTA